MSDSVAPKREGALETLKTANGTRYRGRVYLTDGTRVRVPVPPSYTTEERAREFVRAIQEQEDKHGRLLAKAQAERAERARHVAPEKSKPTAAETCDQWHGRYLLSCAGDDLAQGRWRKWVSPVIGPRAIRTVTRDEVEDVRNALDAAIVRFRKDGRGPDRLMPKSALNVWSEVTSAFKQATASKDRSLRVREDNPCSGVLPPETGPSRKRDFLRPTEAKALIACARIPLEWRQVYAVACYAYLRPGELWELRVQDIDLAAGLVNVSRAIDWKGGEAKAPKTINGVRQVPIDRELAPLLVELVKGRPRGELLFPQLADVNRQKIARVFREHLQTAGVRRDGLYEDTSHKMPVNFRTLRDTGITWLAVAGVAPAAIMRRAGHDDFKTSLGYIKVAEDFSGGAFGQPFPTLPSAFLLATEMATAGAGKTNPPVFAGGLCGAWVGEPGLEDRADPAFAAESPNVNAHRATDQDDQSARNLAPQERGHGHEASTSDAVEGALAHALREATLAGRWDVVSQLAGELEARRLARSAPNVVPIAKAKRTSS